MFLVPDQALQEQNGLRELLNRLLDYRIIHSVGSALTHKSMQGTFAAFTLDIGAYAKFRKLEGRFREIDITAPDARERCRNSPVLDRDTLLQLLQTVPPIHMWRRTATKKRVKNHKSSLRSARSKARSFDSARALRSG